MHFKLMKQRYFAKFREKNERLFFKYMIKINFVKLLIFLQRILVGICRDLTGLTLALTSKTSYMMLFDWMYP
jgi:hypothetical protein